MSRATIVPKAYSVTRPKIRAIVMDQTAISPSKNISANSSFEERCSNRDNLVSRYFKRRAVRALLVAAHLDATLGVKRLAVIANGTASKKAATPVRPNNSDHLSISETVYNGPTRSSVASNSRAKNYFF